MLGRFRLTRSVTNVPSSDDLEPQEASFRVSSPLLDDSEPVFRIFDMVTSNPTHRTRVPNIPPNVKGWTETRAVMMPPKKTRSKRAGDSAYGAGEKSGKKAKVKISSSQ